MMLLTSECIGQNSQLEVNGFEVKTVDRLQNQLLGANGRNSGALISTYLQEGIK